MKIKSLLLAFVIFLHYSCSNSVQYSEEFMAKTSGKYLYNEDTLMDVYYKEGVLYLNWKGGEIKPVALSENEFFVPDMYQKLSFVEHPESGALYMSILPESEEGKITYDYLKVPNDFKTPSMHLRSGNYEQALEGFLAIKEKDSTSPLINQWEINKLGYDYLKSDKHDDAIAVFKLNAKLHPNGFNVFDSLADAYLEKGDSLNAYENYKKAYDINQRNRKALRFIETYETQNDSTANPNL